TGGMGRLGSELASALEARGMRVAIFDLAAEPRHGAAALAPGLERGTIGPFETYPEEAFDRMMEVNVKGALVCCQVVGGRMAEAGRGSIVNVSSVYGLLSPVQDLYEFRRAAGEQFFKPVSYAVSKSALLNLTRYLATYWARAGVRVNTLTPHGVAAGQPEPFVQAFAARSPLGRLMEPRE